MVLCRGFGRRDLRVDLRESAERQEAAARKAEYDELRRIEEQERRQKRRAEQQARESAEEQERERVTNERNAREAQRVQTIRAIENELREALLRAEKIDEGVPTETILSREVATLETLYRAYVGPQQSLSVNDLAGSAGLKPEIALKTARALAKSELVDIEPPEKEYYSYSENISKPWPERLVWLTDKGVKQVHNRHDRLGAKIGVQVNNDQRIGSVNGNVGGPGGDMTVVGGTYLAGGQTSGAELADFVQAVRKLQADLTEEQAEAFEVELNEITSSPAETAPTVRRIISMARLAGKIGVPVIEAGRKLYEAVRPS